MRNRDMSKEEKIAAVVAGIQRSLDEVEEYKEEGDKQTIRTARTRFFNKLLARPYLRKLVEEVLWMPQDEIKRVSEDNKCGLLSDGQPKVKQLQAFEADLYVEIATVIGDAVKEIVREARAIKQSGDNPKEGQVARTDVQLVAAEQKIQKSILQTIDTFSKSRTINKERNELWAFLRGFVGTLIGLFSAGTLLCFKPYGIRLFNPTSKVRVVSMYDSVAELDAMVNQSRSQNKPR